MKNLTSQEIEAVSGGGFAEFTKAVEEGLKEVGHLIHDIVHDC